MQTGQPVPPFTLPDAEGNAVSLGDFAGKWVVLYFYPKDNTPGCTLEAKDFTGFKSEFEALDAVILGVSPDSEKSHCRFRDKHDLGITLLSDTEHSALEAYGAWQLKKNYGREYYGVVRSTFLITPDGALAHHWPKVRAKGHAEAVLALLKEKVTGE